MANLIEHRVELARRGENPYLICRMPSGWLVMGDRQPITGPGYCLLLADPVVSSLNALGEGDRVAYCRDVARIGDALLAVTQAHRINYETLGNAEAALHTHITPRYATEPRLLRRASPAWIRLFTRRFDAPRDAGLIQALGDALET